MDARRSAPRRGGRVVTGDALDDLIAASGQPLTCDDDDGWNDDDDDDWNDWDAADDDDDDGDGVTCPRCLGDGFVSENRLDAETCAPCSGRGWVTP